jgi:hypothetical protein
MSCRMMRKLQDADYGASRLLCRLGNGGNRYGTEPFNCFAMPDLSRVEQYMALADKLVLLADKEELAECSRILAMNLAHYKMKYGELPQDDGMFRADLVELSEQQAELIIEGMETLVGVLGSVIQGLDEKTEH